VYVNYYGAVGGVKNLTFRGLSTENSLILINGNPINDPQNGSVDLSLLSVNAIDRMEVVNGGGSALYGSDALGGVVNIITRHASEDLHARVQGDIGSSVQCALLQMFRDVLPVLVCSPVFPENMVMIITGLFFQRQTMNDTTLNRKDAGLSAHTIILEW